MGVVVEAPDGRVIEFPDEASANEFLSNQPSREEPEAPSSGPVVIEAPDGRVIEFPDEASANKFFSEQSSEDKGLPIPFKNTFEEGSFLREAVEGFNSGVIGIGEGVLGTAALFPDVILDTNLGDIVADGADALRDLIGADPEGLAGEGARIITQYVAPAGKAAKLRRQKVMRDREKAGLKNVPLTATEKTSLASQEVGVAGLADVVVSSDDDKTILGDWVGVGLLETTDLMGLDGRAKALARAGNKILIGADSTLVAAGVQKALTKAGTSLGEFNKSTKGQSINQKISTRAERARKALENVTNKIKERDFIRLNARSGSAEELSSSQKYFQDVLSALRYRGYLPTEVATKRLKIDNVIASEVKVAQKNIADLDYSIKEAIKGLPEGSALDDVKIINRLERYLTETDATKKAQLFSSLPAKVGTKAKAMRTHVDSLSKKIQNSNFIKEKDFTPVSGGQSVKSIIEDNLGSYLRRTYKAVEDAKYKPSDVDIKNANNYFRKNIRATESELTELVRRDILSEEFTDDFLKNNGIDVLGTGKDAKVKIRGNPTDVVVNKARENFYSKYSLRSRQGSGDYFGYTTQQVADKKLDAGLFKGRKPLPKDLARLLGQVTDPKEAYLSTVADLAQFSAIDDYFGTIKTLANNNSGVGKFFKRPASDFEADELQKRGYVRIGADGGTTGSKGKKVKNAGDVLSDNGGWGTLEGFYVPRKIYNNLTKTTLGDSGAIVNGLRSMWGGMLRLKGISQYSKTVLSPITQARNFVTASMFALANGNIPIYGRGQNYLKDASQAVFADMFNKGSDAVFKDLYEAQRRGVLGTSAELREIQDNLSKGMGMKPTTTGSDVLLGGLGEKTKATLEAGFQTKFFEKIYQGSDDYWKYFSYNVEQAKLKRALEGATDQQKIKYLTRNGSDVSLESQALLRKGDVDIDELIKDRAAQLVIDTVPNYNKGASDFIKTVRKLPVGNFITFPAEMFRTGFNIVKQGLEDMASDIPGVQARGRQRLTAFTATTTMVPVATQEFWYGVSGVDREEMDAYQRSFAAPWEKGSVLIPLSKDPETGKITYMNFSTFSPYDVLSRFATRAFNEADDAIKEGADPGTAVSNVAIGTLAEFFDPFIAESIITEAATDILFREGRSSTGAEVYNQEDNIGTKALKITMHVGEALMPNLVPVNFSSGDVEASRLVRSLLGTEDGIITKTDKMGREYSPLLEVGRQISGISPQEFDPKKAMGYAARRLEGRQTDAKRMFNKVTDNENASTAQLNKAFENAQIAKYKVDREYYQMIEDLQTMGLSSKDITRELKKVGINPKDVRRGKFVPFKVSPQNIKKMRNAGILDKFDRGFVSELSKSMRGMTLVPDDEPTGRMDYESPGEKTSAAPAEPPVVVQAPDGRVIEFPTMEAAKNYFASQPRVAPPAPAPAAAPRVPMPSINTITTARAPGPVNPALLGDNPVDQAANAAIANRLG